MATITPIEEIKSRIKIESLIAESLTVVGHGRTLTTREHDSLKIFTQNGTWHQFSSAEGGDIFDWYQRVNKCDFRTALEELAQKAGVELRQLSETERQAVAAERNEKRTRAEILHIAAAYYEEQLWMNPQSVLYCASRGWNEETMRRERIGFSPVVGAEDSSSDNKALSVEPLASRLRDAGVLDHPLSKAVLSVPGGMLVYVHQERGLVKYLSGRSIEGKRHYNLPEEFSGGKQVYENTPVEVKRGVRVLVEGQADAISLGQLGLEAVALCGADGSVKDISHVAFDNDKTGRAKAMHVALGIDPLCRVVTWTTPLRSAQDGANYVQVKDANDILKSDATVDDVVKMLEDSPTALESLAMVVAKTKDEGRKDLLNKFFSVYTGLDEMVQADVMDDLAKHLCGGKISQFKRLLKAYEEENQRQQQSEDDEYSEQHVITPGGFVGDHLFEQCVQKLPTGEYTTYYWVRTPDGKFEKRQSVKIGAICYFPVDPRDEELIRGGDVQFASDREESGSEVELLRDIRKFIHRWLDVPAYYENIASYYVMLSWFYDAGYKTLPYLRALGDYGSGKSRFIHTIGQLCFRPMLFGGGDSEATIYYTLELFKGTMVIDESDFKSSDEAALISKIINLGNNEHGAIKRLDPKPNGQGYRVKRYSVFGPKVFGARESFTDQASDSRCLTHYTTKGTLRPDVPLELTDEFDDHLLRLRNRLLDFRLKNWRVVKIDPNEIDRTVMPRLAQITLALKSIIKDQAMLDELQRFVQIYNQSLVSDRQMTDPAIVVEALVRIRYPRPTLTPVPPDWTITNIASVAQEIQMDFDPDNKFTPKKAGHVLSKQLGIIRRNGRDSQGRIMIFVDDDELGGLMNRYGISKPEWTKNGNL